MVFEEVFSRRQIEERRAADAGPAASAVQARLDAPAPGGARTLRLHVLASGSRGNAAVVEDASTGAGVLVDCGICKRDFLARCDEAGFDPARLAAILVTHDHTDHTKGLGVVLRGLAKKGIEPAVYAEDAVRAASSEVRALEDAHDVRSLHAGDALSLAGRPRPARVPHLARRGRVVRVPFESAGGDVAGFVTDTGVVTGEAPRASCMRGCWRWRQPRRADARRRPLPVPGEAPRGLGRWGTGRNDQAAAELEALLCDELEQVVAMHISQNNNTYRLPAESLAAVVRRASHPAAVQAALQSVLVSVG